MKNDKFIELIKLHGYDVAIDLMAREENKNWKCPVCMSKVEPTRQERFESLVEHVTDPNKEEYPLRDAYTCINNKCECNKLDLFWDHNGDLYGRYNDSDIKFINDNNAPFGSYSRKSNVEIHKKGLKDMVYLHPALCLWFLQPYIEYDYISNTDGEVLKRKWSIGFLKKNERGEYSYKFTTALHTWKYLFRVFKGHIDHYDKTQSNDSLIEAFEKSFNRSWEYRVFEWFAKTFYREHYYRYELINKK